MNLTGAMERQFGSAWRRAGPATESEVAAFETEHGIALPEPYRRFVIAEANGASGPPAYGLVPLGEPSDPTGSHAVVAGSLREPFPLAEAWSWEGEPDADAARIEAVHRDGALPLGTDGDGMDYVLVVSGPARGQVWLLAGEGAIPVAADFGSWIEGDVLPEATWTLGNRER